MQDLLPLAEKLGARLKARGDTIAIAESSTGGLISAALLSVAGASAYFRGGSVIYTQYARSGFLEIPNPLPNGMRASSEPYAALLATTVREPARFHLGLKRNRSHGPDRQSLWRRGGAHLHRPRRAEFLACHHAGDRQRGSRGQHAGVLEASDGTAGGGVGVDADPAVSPTGPRCAPCRRAARQASARSPGPSAPGLPRWDAAVRRAASASGRRTGRGSACRCA